MARILVMVAIAALGYLGYMQFVAGPGGSSGSEYRYSLATVDERPIPKKELIALWHERALRQCEKAKQEHNLTPDECRRKVEERSSACGSNAAQDVPERVATRELAKKVGRHYLDCVTPYYYCNGKEVRTEAEVLANCR